MLKAGGEANRKNLIKQFEDISLTTNYGAADVWGKQMMDRTLISKEEEMKGKHGDYGQAENLLQ